MRQSTSASSAQPADTVLVPTGTYPLTIPGANEDANQTGDLDILDHVTLTGDGADLTIVDGQQIDRVLDMWTGLTVEIDALTVTHGRVQDDNGGGIYNRGTLTLNDVALLANAVVSADSYGGGGLSSEAWALDSSVTLNHCLVQGNSVGRYGGGVQLLGQTGPASVTLVNTTLAGNSAGLGGGAIEANNRGAGAPVAFKNSLVAGNSAPANVSCENPDEGFGPGILDSLGNNLEDHDLCEFDQPTDLPDTDPLLGPLQDNGGPTWIHALLTGSPAIDAGDDSACPPTDQRGMPRPQGPASDIGV